MVWGSLFRSRLREAENETRHKDAYLHVVVNDVLEDAIIRLIALMESYGLKAETGGTHSDNTIGGP